MPFLTFKLFSFCFPSRAAANKKLKELKVKLKKEAREKRKRVAEKLGDQVRHRLAIFRFLSCLHCTAYALLLTVDTIGASNEKAKNSR